MQPRRQSRPCCLPRCLPVPPSSPDSWRRSRRRCTRGQKLGITQLDPSTAGCPASHPRTPAASGAGRAHLKPFEVSSLQGDRGGANRPRRPWDSFVQSCLNPTLPGTNQPAFAGKRNQNRARLQPYTLQSHHRAKTLGQGTLSAFCPQLQRGQAGTTSHSSTGCQQPAAPNTFEG